MVDGYHMNSLYTAEGYHICSWSSADGYHNNQKCDRHTHTQTNEQNLETIILDFLFRGKKRRYQRFLPTLQPA